MPDVNKALTDLEAVVVDHETHDAKVVEKMTELTNQVTTLQAQVFTDEHEKKVVDLTERLKKLLSLWSL